MSSNRQYVVPILLALVVVLAGCSGGGTASPESTADGPDGGTGPAATLPTDLNVSYLEGTHGERLSTASSFTTSLNYSISNATQTLYLETTANIEADGSVGFERFGFRNATGDGIFLETYTDDGTTYERTAFVSGGQEQAQYSRGEEPYDEFGVTPVNASSARFPELVTSVGGGVTWEQQGTTTYEGTEVVEYTASGEAAFDASFREQVQPSGGLFGTSANITEYDGIEATLLLDEDGVIRQLRYEASGTQDGEQLTVTLTVTFEDIGSTTVSEPSWLDEARQQT
jgi:hypothetical protein